MSCSRTAPPDSFRSSRWKICSSRYRSTAAVYRLAPIRSNTRLISAPSTLTVVTRSVDGFLQPGERLRATHHPSDGERTEHLEAQDVAYSRAASAIAFGPFGTVAERSDRGDVMARN